MMHSLKGQMIVGPCPLISVYNSKGDHVSSMRDILSTVGSGERVSGDKATKTATPSEVVSEDDTNDPEPVKESSDVGNDEDDS
jgi:hypothetical protein